MKTFYYMYPSRVEMSGTRFGESGPKIPDSCAVVLSESWLSEEASEKKCHSLTELTKKRVFKNFLDFL